VGDYTDEIRLTVRPVLEMLYELNKDNNFTFETVQKFYFWNFGSMGSDQPFLSES
jgi:hypothetical protein